LLLVSFAITACPALRAQSAPAPLPSNGPLPGVRHIIGFENVKAQQSGTLSVQSGALLFDAVKSQAQIGISSIDDILTGSETTQSNSRTSRGIELAAVAAPYGSGRAVSLLVRKKVDILTLLYRDANHGIHGAIFSVPKGRAADFRMQLIAAGAHASAPGSAPASAPGSAPLEPR
jgi:hypothetical protein